MLKVGGDLQREKIDDIFVIFRAGGLKGLLDGSAYFGDAEVDLLAIPLNYSVHFVLLFVPLPS